MNAEQKNKVWELGTWMFALGGTLCMGKTSRKLPLNI